MPWIIFDEEDHRKPAPGFCMTSLRTGNCWCLKDLHEKYNQVLFFAHDPDCEDCYQALKLFARRLPEYQDEQAQLVVIVPFEPKVLDYSQLPFDLLLDPQANVYKAYAKLVDPSLVANSEDMLFVLDRYSAPYVARIDTNWDSEVIGDEVLSWLRYIDVQCPE